MQIFLILNMLNSAKRMGDCDSNFVSLVGGNVFCYANSLFQCLNNIKPVTDFFKSDSEAITPFDNLIFEIFNMLKFSKGKSIDLHLYYKQIIDSINNTNFISTSFNDPFEFLTLILSYRDKNQTDSLIYTTTSNLIALKKNELNDIFIYETENKKDYFILFEKDKSLQETALNIFNEENISVFPKILIFQYINEQINIEHKLINKQNDNEQLNHQNKIKKVLSETKIDESKYKIEDFINTDIDMNETSFNIIDNFDESLFDDKPNNSNSILDQKVSEIKIEENNLSNINLFDNLQSPKTFETEIIINGKSYKLNSLIINLYNASHYYAIIRLNNKYYKLDDEIITEIYHKQYFGDIYTAFYEINE